MRLLRRIVIHFCTLLVLITLFLYPLSYRQRLFVGWQRMKQGTAPDCHSVELFVTRGSVCMEICARDTFWVSSFQLSAPDWWDRDGLYAGASAAHPVHSPDGAFNAWGFHFHRLKQPISYMLEHTIVAVPLWLVIMVLAAYPTFEIVRHRRRRIRGDTCRCPDCGYDIRATPHRCPECGRNISPVSSTITVS
jgi:hypothetical protein